jgi:hypothetical protein
MANRKSNRLITSSSICLILSALYLSSVYSSSSARDGTFSSASSNLAANERRGSVNERGRECSQRARRRADSTR